MAYRKEFPKPVRGTGYYDSTLDFSRPILIGRRAGRQMAEKRAEQGGKTMTKSTHGEYRKWLKTWDDAPEGAHSDDGKATPYASIQWKGTDACVDFHCVCGSHLHFDEEFLYFVRCLDCRRLYSMGSYVEVREVPEEHVPYAEADCHPKEALDEH